MQTGSLLGRAAVLALTTIALLAQDYRAKPTDPNMTVTSLYSLRLQF